MLLITNNKADYSDTDTRLCAGLYWTAATKQQQAAHERTHDTASSTENGLVWRSSKAENFVTWTRYGGTLHHVVP